MATTTNENVKQKKREKSIRIILPEELYARLKAVTPDHGDISRIVRTLLKQYIKKAEAEVIEEP